MLIETLSVREAREQLPSVLERFRKGDRTPVGVGSHRKTEAVMVPVEVFDELTAERTRSLSQAAASVRAEGLAAGADVDAITERWARGEISTAQMRELVRQLYLEQRDLVAQHNAQLLSRSTRVLEAHPRDSSVE
jgi:PHD/YefM family antitoxin component YafN of YafNO toxin-antitoxin module